MAALAGGAVALTVAIMLVAAYSDAQTALARAEGARLLAVARTVALAPQSASTAETGTDIVAATRDSAGRYRVIADVNVRQGPSNDSPRVGGLMSGTEVEVDADSLGWLRVRLTDGSYGFVYKKWLEPIAPQP